MSYCCCNDQLKQSFMASALKRLHCEQFRVTIKFKEEDFDRSTFMEQVAPEDREGTAFYFDYKSQKTPSEHAHGFIGLAPDRCELALTFASGRPSKGASKRPYMEEAASVIAPLFKQSTHRAEVFAIFEYGKGFDSAIQLNYPLLAGPELVSGATVIGHDLVFPPGLPADVGSISLRPNGSVVLFLSGWLEMDLSKFDLYSEVKRFAVFADQFVKEKEGHAKRRKAKN